MAFDYLEVDLENSNDIANALVSSGFDEFVVLEDFHRLEEEVQRSVAEDLKTFYEYPDSQVRFLVLGVWLEQGRLEAFCGDLAGRVEDVNAGSWSNVELEKVIEKGAKELNIGFSDRVVVDLVRGCHGNVGILQQACERVCLASAVDVMQIDIVDRAALVKDAYDSIVSSEKDRFVRRLKAIAKGFGPTVLEVYKWIVDAVIEVGSSNPSSLYAGITRDLMVSKICERHTKKPLIRANKRVITASLRNIRKLQQVGRTEHVFDFIDDRLQVVDHRLILVLARFGANRLREEIGLPVDQSQYDWQPEDELEFHRWNQEDEENVASRDWNQDRSSNDLPPDAERCRYCGYRPQGASAEKDLWEKIRFHETSRCEAAPDFQRDG